MSAITKSKSYLDALLTPSECRGKGVYKGENRSTVHKSELSALERIPRNLNTKDKITDKKRFSRANSVQERLRGTEKVERKKNLYAPFVKKDRQTIEDAWALLRSRKPKQAMRIFENLLTQIGKDKTFSLEKSCTCDCDLISFIK